MNAFEFEIAKVSGWYFAFGNHIVCVLPYKKTPQPPRGHGYIDGYYEVSNRAYHASVSFCQFCGKQGEEVEAEREEPYRSLILRAGYFSAGKNGLVFSKQFGSKMFFVVLKFEEPKSAEFAEFLQTANNKGEMFLRDSEDGCGDCNLCVSACPKSALPGKMELCLREEMAKGQISAGSEKLLGARVLGCEVCSNVCPKNRHIEFEEDSSYELIDLEEKVKNKDAELCQKYGKNIIGKKMLPFISNAQRNAEEENI